MWLFPSQPHGRKTARFQNRLGANSFVHALSRTSCQPKSASITIQNACLHLHGSKLASSTCQVDASNKSRGVWFSGNIVQERFSCSCTSKNRYSLNLGNQQMHPWADASMRCFMSKVSPIDFLLLQWRRQGWWHGRSFGHDKYPCARRTPYPLFTGMILRLCAQAA